MPCSSTFLFSIALLAVPAGALFRPGRVQLAKESVAKIATYVINLDARTDKCDCMRRQLAGKAEPLYRQSADAKCPHLKRARFKWIAKSKIPGAEQSLFCQNYMIWQAANMSGDADYVLILEDDALLVEGFMDRIRDLISGCTEFDYLVVDPTFRSRGVTHPRCPGLSVPKRGVWFGTAMQIIPTAFLSRLIRRAESVGWAPVDHWWKRALSERGYRAYAWRAALTVQATHPKAKGTEDMIRQDLERIGCPWSTTTSDIDSSRAKLSTTGRAEGGVAPYSCPGDST